MERRFLPDNYIGVLHPEPGREHPSIGAAHSDHRAALGSLHAALQALDQHCEVSQRLLGRQEVQPFAVLEAEQTGML